MKNDCYIDRCWQSDDYSICALSSCHLCTRTHHIIFHGEENTPLSSARQTRNYLRRIFFLRRGGCGCSRRINEADHSAERMLVINYQKWDDEERNGQFFPFFFFYLVDNVRKFTRKKETVQKFKQVKDTNLFLKKKNKGNSREIDDHLARYMKDNQNSPWKYFLSLFFQ